jgi:FkbM family methyltransferase
MIKVKHKDKTVLVDNKNFERDLVDLDKLPKILPQNPVCIDCGCNYGNHTVYYSVFLKAKKVYSFEPMPKIYESFLKVLEANDIENVESYNMGVSAKEKDITICSTVPRGKGAIAFQYKGEDYPLPPYKMGYVGHKRPKRSENINIKSKPLDDIIKGKVDYIKVDVEGMEMEVLEGASRIIRESKPIIYIEIWNRNTKNLEKFKEWKLKNSYKGLATVRGPNFLIGPNS